MIELVLPWPPSVNHYYARNRNGSVRVGKAGLAFRDAVWLACRQKRVKRLLGPLAVEIVAYPPDKRRRDLDNTLKACLDALQHGQAYEDDSQIAFLVIERGPVTKGGRLTVTIAPHP